jgi:hypothetical protein
MNMAYLEKHWKGLKRVRTSDMFKPEDVGKQVSIGAYGKYNRGTFRNRIYAVTPTSITTGTANNNYTIPLGSYVLIDNHNSVYRDDYEEFKKAYEYDAKNNTPLVFSRKLYGITSSPRGSVRKDIATKKAVGEAQYEAVRHKYFGER